MIDYIFANQLLVGFMILSIATLILLVVVIIMHFRMRRFLINIAAKDIKESLDFTYTNLKELQEFRKELESYLASVEKRLRKSIQSVHTVRFNPFKGSGDGGNQSFATAFLNENGDGVVISSLFSRDQTSVFSKPVKEHSSEFELSQEEAEALKNAKVHIK